jgi:hypothetical protein
MIIGSEPNAAAFLACIHYYRLTIFFHKLMVSPDHFREGSDIPSISSTKVRQRNSSAPCHLIKIEKMC